MQIDLEKDSKVELTKVQDSLRMMHIVLAYGGSVNMNEYNKLNDKQKNLENESTLHSF